MDSSQTVYIQIGIVGTDPILDGNAEQRFQQGVVRLL